jgi:hypothetical protein
MFTLRIEQGNAAMQTAEDIAGALRRVAAKLEDGYNEGLVRDDNGNTVGDFAHNRQALTQHEFSDREHRDADRLAALLGYEQTAYTSTSALWGLYCLRDSGDDPKRGGCIIATDELGLVFVQTEEELRDV